MEDPTSELFQTLKNKYRFSSEKTGDCIRSIETFKPPDAFDKINLWDRKNIIEYYCFKYHIQASTDMITVLATYNHEFLNHGAGLEPICKMLPFWESQPFESPIQRVEAIVAWFRLHDNGDDILTNPQQCIASFKLELFDAICVIEEVEWEEIADAAMGKSLRKCDIGMMCIEFKNKIVNKDTLIDKINKWVKDNNL